MSTFSVEYDHLLKRHFPIRCTWLRVTTQFSKTVYLGIRKLFFNLYIGKIISSDKKLNNLSFAFDILIISNNLHDFHTRNNDLYQESNNRRLKMSMSKTKIMSNSELPTKKLVYVTRHIYPKTNIQRKPDY